MFQKVEKSKVTTFVPDADLGAFFVLVTTYDIPFEEVVPGVASLKRACIEKLNLLLLYSEEEVLSRLNQNHVYVVIAFQTKDRASFRLLQNYTAKNIDLTVSVEAKSLGKTKTDYAKNWFLLGSINVAQDTEIYTVEHDISIGERSYKLHWLRFVISLQQLQISQVA